MNLAGNPWEIFPVDKNHRIKEGKAFVTHVTYSDYADPAHRFRLVDHMGYDVVNIIGSSDLCPIEVLLGGISGYKGLYVAEFDSGRAYLHIE